MYIRTCEVELDSGVVVRLTGSGADVMKVLQALHSSEEVMPPAHSNEPTPPSTIENIVYDPSRRLDASNEVRKYLGNSPTNKIGAIRVYREYCGAGLKDAKEAVEQIMADWSAHY
jgi:hypothetical protein